MIANVAPKPGGVCESSLKGQQRSLNWEKEESCVVLGIGLNKGIGDAGSTADFRMLWSAIVCFGLGLL